VLPPGRLLAASLKSLSEPGFCLMYSFTISMLRRLNSSSDYLMFFGSRARSMLEALKTQTPCTMKCYL
jgi:hypothetical protein